MPRDRGATIPPGNRQREGHGPEQRELQRLRRFRREVQAEKDHRRLLHAAGNLRRRARLRASEMGCRGVRRRAAVLAGRRLRGLRVPGGLRRGRQPAVLHPCQDPGVLPRARHQVLPVRAVAHVPFRKALHGGRPHRLRLQHHLRERRRGAHRVRHEPRRGERPRDGTGAGPQAERRQRRAAQGNEEDRRQVRVPRRRADGSPRAVARSARHAVQGAQARRVPHLGA